MTAPRSLTHAGLAAPLPGSTQALADARIEARPHASSGRAPVTQGQLEPGVAEPPPAQVGPVTPPRPSKLTAALPLPAAPRAGTGPQRVLVVDDSRSIRTLLKIYLAGRAFDFVEAESAEEALKLLQQRPVDLILTDLHLEGMSGADLASRVRADAGLHRTPVLLISGERDLQRLATLAKSAGVNSVISKPISCSQLMGVVDKLLPPPRKP